MSMPTLVFASKCRTVLKLHYGKYWDPGFLWSYVVNKEIYEFQEVVGTIKTLKDARKKTKSECHNTTAVSVFPSGRES